MDYKAKFNSNLSYLKQTVLKCGFSIGGERKYDDYCYLSLRNALVAYFSTYKETKHGLHLFRDYPKIHEDADFNTHTGYIAEAFKCVVFFQHFFELAVKEILRQESPLLAGDTSTRPEVLYKLVKSQPLSDDEIYSLQSPQFGETLKRAVTLVNKGCLDKAKYGFISDSEIVLNAVNDLRNRMWHRGVYVLRYPALDEFIGGHVLPLLNKFIALPEFSGNELFWKYRNLFCKADPINEIIAEFAKGSFDIKKIALLKEMGRSAYESPILPAGKPSWFTLLEEKEVDRAKMAASAEEMSNRVEQCPICGIEAMAKYEDSDTVGEQYDDDGEMIGFDQLIRYIFEVRCFYCGFNVDSMVGNPKDHGLNIPDLFQEL